jgi:flagellar hook-length control protein FliK
MVESARLVQTGGRSEMHIGINSDSLGTVDVHAVMHSDASGVASVDASITVQSHEAAAMLTKELPALQGHLEERNVHVGEIAVIPESLSAGSGMQQQQGGGPQESYARQPRGSYAMADSGGSPRGHAAADSAAQSSWAAGNGRLSVMA